jgi:tRNA C32,U32 (ribose-2'-O)-methylase TrmJ
MAKGTRLATVGEVEGVWARVRELLDAAELNPDPHVRKGLYDRFQNWLLRSRPDVRDVNALHGAVSTLVSKHERLEGLKEALREGWQEEEQAIQRGSGW